MRIPSCCNGRSRCSTARSSSTRSTPRPSQTATAARWRRWCPPGPRRRPRNDRGLAANRAAGLVEAFRLDRLCQAAQAFLVAGAADRDRELAVGDHPGVALAELAGDRVVGADRREGVEGLVRDVLGHLLPALRARQELQLVGQAAQTVMLEGGAVLRRRGVEG